MRIIKIKKKGPKGSNNFRTIYMQTTAREKHLFRSLAWLYEQLFFQKEKTIVCHGFVTGRNCVTNAMQHINKKYTLTIDLKSFFDYVSVSKLVKQGVPRDLAQSSVYQHRTRQGLSSSPMAANIAAMGIDQDILKLIENTDCVYTRYADDMSISSNDIELLKNIKTQLNKIVKSHHFRINHKKTRIQSADYGRRVITGIAVDDKCYPTRRNRRKLRALVHKFNNEKDPNKKTYLQKQIRGMSEFNQCKLPNPDKEYGQYGKKIKFYPTIETIRVTPDYLTNPEWVMIKDKFNLDIFGIITSKVGIERCIKYLPHRVLDENKMYRLLHIDIHETRPNGTSNPWRRLDRVYLEMQNPSVEGLVHIEPVHPRCRTIQEAINYRRYGQLNNPINWEPVQLS